MLPPDALSQWPTDREFSSYFSLADRPVEFYREKIIIRIVKGFMDVKGIYYFRNNTGKSMNLPMVYPFPVDEFHNVPDTINIDFYNGTGNETLDFRMFRNGEYSGLTLPLKKGANNIMSIFYRQKLKGSTARYILTTTTKWGRPFELAEYEIFVSGEHDSVTVNFPCSTDNQDEEMKHLFFSGKNFMPDKDLIIKWK